MAGRLFIDAHYSDETRIAILDENGNLENFEVEHSKRKQIKGNIYLARVVRIEPSIQAAFIDYGEEKNGFLPLSEIHYDYFNKDALNEEESKYLEDDSHVRGFSKHFKIQDVITNKQVFLVQAEKEVRGNKCAFFTTFISIPGRYCVLTPNPPKGKSTCVSKRLEASEKERLREIIDSLDIPDGMGCIVRTAGENRAKQEIKRDLEYLVRLWNEIKDEKGAATAPALLYEEGNIVKRTIRDLYSRTMDGITIQGAEAYKEARTFMKLFTPSHVKKIELYKDNATPLFHKHDIEEKIKEILNPVVHLPSGGSIVIDVTEALIAIDVNSGKSKSEKDLNGTALKTNLEAVTEIARQIRLRDIAGIIVIDFIDMANYSSNSKVEHKMREAMKQDYSSVQIGKISQFGLMEISRQRLRQSLSETSFVKCKHCCGVGKILSIEVVALSVIRKIESSLVNGNAKSIIVEVASGVDLYILNNKRRIISEMEGFYQVYIEITRNQTLVQTDCKILIKEFKATDMVDPSNNIKENCLNISIPAPQEPEIAEKNRPLSKPPEPELTKGDNVAQKADSEEKMAEEPAKDQTPQPPKKKRRRRHRRVTDGQQAASPEVSAEPVSPDQEPSSDSEVKPLEESPPIEEAPRQERPAKRRRPPRKKVAAADRKVDDSSLASELMQSAAGGDDAGPKINYRKSGSTPKKADRDGWLKKLFG
ncbi:MAG: Rne/Rng family ribonuclease [Holosporales bacterium]|jgi:ribonuclease E|nr:Rne/Rng family ribonuclease [Holosporales bacterium]